MENASKALLIAGAILLCILIIAIGMFIYNSASTAITESLTSMSTQQIESFNNQFTTYQGAQSGSNVKSLLGRLIANADTNRNEITKIPNVHIDKKNNLGFADGYTNAKIYQAGNTLDYIKYLSQIRNLIQLNHEYWIDITYQQNGLIDFFVITYDGKPMSDENLAKFHR